MDELDRAFSAIASAGPMRFRGAIIWSDAPRPWWKRLRYWLFRRREDSPLVAVIEGDAE
jgi:hypothetical protein